MTKSFTLKSAILLFFAICTSLVWARDWVVNPFNISGSVVNNQTTGGTISKAVHKKDIIYSVPTPASPTITGFSPSSGPVGTSVTISGTNFNATKAGNIVFFGATRAIVTDATESSLTVTVPIGATFQPISILDNGTQLTGYSAMPFVITFSPNNSTITTANFSSQQDLHPASTSTAQFMTTGDLDGDGKADVVSVNSDPVTNTVSIFRNIASIGTITAASFADKIELSLDGTPGGIAISDLDGDGKPDLVVLDVSGKVSVFRNTSTTGVISFAPKVDLTVLNGVSVTVGDLDNDGKPDVVVSDRKDGTVYVFRNTSTNGNISFVNAIAAATFTTGGPESVAIGDLNGDGKADMTVANKVSGLVSIFTNISTNGNIAFGTAINLTPGTKPVKAAIGDFNADGKPDLAVANSTSSTVSVFQNTSSNGTISFAAKVDLAADTKVTTVAITDLDGDGKVDIVSVAVNGGGMVSVFRNTYTSGNISASSFAAKSLLIGLLQDVTIGDIDGDGRPDLAGTNLQILSVFRYSPFMTKVSASFSGKTLAAIDSAITADPVSSATSYRFRITQGSNVQTIDAPTNSFKLTQLTDYAYSTSYSIDVQVQAGGIWGDYGAKTVVTTPAPLTQISNILRGTTLASIDSAITADPLPLATAYRFRATQGSNVQTIDVQTNSFKLTQLANHADNTSYSIDVQVEVGGNWSDYGTAYIVNTPAPLTQPGTFTQISASFRGKTLASIDSAITADPIPSATDYRFRVTRGADVQTLDVQTNSFTLTQLTNYAYNTSYSIDVQAQIDGNWNNYGTAYVVTTPAPLTQISELFSGKILANTDSVITADPIPLATGYRFRVIKGAAVQTVDAQTSSFKLKELPNYAYNTRYSMDVAVKTGATVNAFGAAILVTTPAVPVTQVTASYCGATLTDLDGAVRSDGLPLATAYRFRVKLGDSPAQIIEEAGAQTLLYKTTFYAYNTTYTVDVSANVNGTWTDYGAACNVTTLPAPITQVSLINCGKLLTSNDAQISIDHVPTATAYRLRITTNGQTDSLDEPTNFARLGALPSYEFNTTYSVRVSAFVNGVWTPYGAACDVTTPALVPQISTEMCGTVLKTIDGEIHEDLIPATSFRFIVTDGTHIDTLQSQVGSIRLSSVPFYAYNTVYSVRVAVQRNGIWTAYGPACNVTTMAVPVTQLASNVCGTILSTAGDVHADNVPTATAYRFRATQGSNVQTFDSPTAAAKLTSFPGYAFNTIYSIDVSAEVTGTWIPYGVACNVTTAAPLTNANLSSLVINSGTLSPAFDTATLSYTASVGNSTTTITLKPSVADATATVKVNDILVTSGSNSGSINLNVGQNLVTVIVTAQDGTTTKTYNVTVTRAPSANANLAALTLSTGTLIPVFNPAKFSYTALVDNTVATITLTPTVSDTTAKVTVNNTLVTSGTPSGDINLNVGENTITAIVTAQDGTTTKSTSVVVTRDKAAQNITFGTLPVKTYGDIDFAPGATSDNTGITVIYTSSNTTVATVVSGLIHVVGAGTTLITASQGSDSTHYAATDMQQTLTVDQATLTITADNKTRIYGLANPTLTASYSGFVNNDTEANLTSPGALSTAAIISSPVDTYPIIASGAVDSNYTIGYSPGTLTITNATNTTSTLTGKSVTYDGTTKSLEVADLPNGATVVYTGNDQTDVGIYPVTAVLSQANYDDLTLSDTLKIINATNTTTTLAGTSVTYDGTAKSLAVANLPSGATVVYTGNDQTDVGAYPVTAVVSQANYDDLSLSGTLTITNATNSTTTLASNTITYDGTAKSLAVADLPSGATVVYTGNGQTDVGVYPVTAVVSQANYDDLSLGGTLTITNATNIITTLADNSVTFDGTAKSLAVANLPSGATVVYTGNDQTDVGSYPVTAVVSQTNYDDLTLSGNLTITNATNTTTTMAGNSITYDGTAKSLAVANLPSGATVVYTGNDQTDVGSYLVTAVVSQTNYDDLTLSGNLTITNATNTTTTLAGNSITYDGTAKSLAVADLPSGATVVYTGNDQTDVGTYPVTAVVSQGNYDDLALSGTLTITNATNTTTTLTGTSVTYDGTTQGLEVANLPNGATVVYSGNDQTDVGTYPVTAVISQANYDDLALSGTLTITNATNTATTLTGTSVTYDGTTQGLEVANLPNGATVVYSGNDQTDVGTYPVTAVVSQANYDDLALSGTLTITNATNTTTTLTGTSVTYDGTAKSLAVANLPNGATVAYTGNVQTDVGVYSITAIVSQANYDDLTLNGTLTITNAINTITSLTGTSITYDGTAKSLAVADLQGGATVVYTGNDQTNVGVYPVTAVVSEANYDDLALSGTLTITNATNTTTTLAGTSVTYDGTAKSLAVANLPNGGTVVYTGNDKTDVGVYPVTAVVSEANYDDLILSGTLTITNATNTITSLTGTSITYDGTAQSLAVAYLPNGATVVYTGNGQTNVGVYPITATVSQPNYANLILSGTLTITNATNTVTTLASNTVTYNGMAENLVVANLPSGATVVYTGNDQTDVGIYPVTAVVSQANYDDLNLSGTLTITNATNSTTTLTGNSAAYDGTAKSLAVANLPSGAIVVYTGNSQTDVGAYPVTAIVSQANYDDLTLSGTLTITNATNTTTTLAGKSIIYDGTAQSLAIANLPNGATVVYTGNDQTDVGSYPVTAIVSQANYDDLTLSGTLTITNATNTTTTLAGKSIIYDGTAQSLAIANLPNGATVVYTGNDQTYVGSYPVTAIVSQANYDDLTLSGTLTITNATNTTTTLAGTSVTYDGTAKSLAVANLPNGATVVYSNNSQTNVGVYTVTATVSQPNYTDLILSGTLTITNATNTETTLASNSITYDGTAKSLVVAGLPNGAIVVYTGNGQTDVGTYSVTAVVSQGNYDNLTLNGTLTITNATNTTTTLAGTSVTYDGTAKSLAVAHLPNGATVVYTGNSQTDVGTYPVTAVVSQANYDDITLNATLTITNATNTTTTLAGTSVTYDGTAKSLAVTNLPNGATVVYTGNSQTDVGTYPVTAVVSQANYNNLTLNGTLTITNATNTTTTLTGINVTYDGTTKSLVASGIPNGATVTYNANAQKAAGVYLVTAKVTRTGYSDLNLSATLTINKAALSITTGNNTKTYGAVNPTLTLIYDGFVTGDDATTLTAQPVVFTQATSASNAGVYPVKVNGATSANYTITYHTGLLTVNRAGLNITADDQTRLYRKNNPTLTATYTGFVNGDSVTSLTTAPVFATTANVNSTVGTYTISVAGAASDNYVISYTPGNLTVASAVLTITATNQSKIYGDVNPALTFTYNGFANGDSPSSLSKLPTITTTATSASATGTYPITLSGATSADYTIVYKAGTLKVNKANLTIIADNKSRNYGKDNPALTAKYNGFVNDDTQASLISQPQISTIANSSSLPGNYAIAVDGASSDNYNIGYIAGNLTIIPLSTVQINNLAISAGTLSPGFAVDAYNYNASVGFNTGFLAITPGFDGPVIVTVNGMATGNGAASGSIALNEGDNTITVTATAQDGVTTKTYTITIHRAVAPSAIVASNILSPNGDGKNDVWVIKDIQLYPNNIVTVYDRAGRAVYSKKGYNNDWNGTLRGAPLTGGTYFYIIDLDPQLQKIKGFITILK